MKKGLALLFVLIMVLWLAACGSNDANTTTGDSSPTRPTEGTSNSTETSKPEHEHSYISEVTTAATCAATGIRTFTCTGCGDTKTEEIAKIDHTYDNGKVTTAATCTATGIKTFTCTGCGDTRTEGIVKTSHTYDNGKVTTAATCVATGIKTFTCTGCGDTRTEGIVKTSHTYDNGKVTTAATCTATGIKTFTCTGCGDTQTKTIQKEDHQYSKATCTEAAKCSTCGDVKGSALGHNWTAATCSKPKTCYSCQQTEGNPLSHYYSSTGTCYYCGTVGQQPTFILPETPVIVHRSYYGTLVQTCEITSISVSCYNYSRGEYQIKFTYLCTYRKEGNNGYFVAAKYKLYDQDNMVLSSSTLHISDDLVAGEKSESSLMLYNLEPGKTYTLKIID